MDRIIAQLESLGFYLGLDCHQVTAIKRTAIRRATVFDDQVPRLFTFDLEDNYENEGEELENAVKQALVVVCHHDTLILADRAHISESENWQDYATRVGRDVNAALERIGFPERLYLTRFDELSCGCLLTEEMAELIGETGVVDPESATLYKP